MLKRFLSLLVLLCFSSAVFATELTGSVQRIQEIVRELQEIQKSRESCLQELENLNSEREKELQERIAELNEREKELNGLKRHLELFGDLIDDQAIYFKSLQRKLVFWRTTSIVVSVSLVAVIAITPAVTKRMNR